MGMSSIVAADMELLKTECCSFLHPWKFIHVQDKDHTFHMLFKMFTQDIWLSVASHVVSSHKLPNLKHLKEAMSTWMPQRIKQILGKDQCCLLPSTHGLAGKYTKNTHSTSFAEMHTIFLPTLDISIQ
jgi:hypothetical protein